MKNYDADKILKFWENAGPAAWWRKDLEFDNQIKSRFGKLHEQAINKKLDDWRHRAEPCLALVILLDQFSRNMFRDDAKTFDQDSYALELAKHAISNEYFTQVSKQISGFFFLPYMHSEDLADQQKCIELMREYEGDGSLKAAIEHRDIIVKFGRFPHRNIVLGRKTTAAEQAFLDDGGFAG